jgi:NAD(P)-dependent dehydrogenase (short-subunit alcohol dehydrogenase family)
MAEWRRIVDVDLVGSISLLEQLRPHLCPGAAAVAIASMSAYLCPPDEVVDPALNDPLGADFDDQLSQAAEKQPLLQDSGMAYAWSKAALTRWVTRAASAWGNEGKRLVSISPGLIDTDMGRLENNSMSAERLSAMKQRIALERLGTADDIAHTAHFLASDKAAYITGCDILVDGGFVASVQAAAAAV